MLVAVNQMWTSKCLSKAFIHTTMSPSFIFLFTASVSGEAVKMIQPVPGLSLALQFVTNLHVSHILVVQLFQLLYNLVASIPLNKCVEATRDGRIEQHTGRISIQGE